jgi:cyclophilin family peptidyl-prolyl cis-trans isomerase
MRQVTLRAALLVACALPACGPQPPAELRAVFAPETVVVRSNQAPATALRLQNTGRGTATLPAGLKAADGLRLQALKGPEPDNTPVGEPLRPAGTSGAGDEAIPLQWPYGHQKTIPLSLPVLFPDLGKPGSYRLTWSLPPFVDPAPAEIHVVPAYASILTTFGPIVIEFHPEDAPKTVLNFVKLSRQGFYNGLTFHRIIPGFMMQGGCPRGDGMGDAGYKIKAEFNARKHVAGTVSMARSNDPDSAGSQFFICFAPTSHLDGKYTAFAEVVRGMEVAKKVEAVGTAPEGRPTGKVVMEKVTLLDTLPDAPK